MMKDVANLGCLLIALVTIQAGTALACHSCDDKCPPDPTFVQTDKRDMVGLAKARAARDAKGYRRHTCEDD